MEELTQILKVTYEDFSRGHAAEVAVRSVPPCDGSNELEVREWIEAVEMTITKSDRTVEIAEQSAMGLLRKELNRWIRTTSQEQLTWINMKEQVRKNFLSANEEEKLRLEFGKMRRNDGESYLAFNRRFRDLANKAYPEPRSEGDERIAIRAYAKGVNDVRMARRLIVDARPKDLEHAMKYVEYKEAGNDLFNDLDIREETPMEVDSTEQNKLAEMQRELQKTKKATEQLIARFEHNQRQVSGNQRQANTNWGQYKRQPSNTRRIQCYECGGPHFARDCFTRQRGNNSSRGGWNTRNTQSHQVQGNSPRNGNSMNGGWRHAQTKRSGESNPLN